LFVVAGPSKAVPAKPSLQSRPSKAVPAKPSLQSRPCARSSRELGSCTCVMLCRSLRGRLLHYLDRSFSGGLQVTNNHGLGSFAFTRSQLSMYGCIR
jgi:hypothetical protein